MFAYCKVGDILRSRTALHTYSKQTHLLHGLKWLTKQFDSEG
jgi:hypothetical protein